MTAARALAPAIVAALLVLASTAHAELRGAARVFSGDRLEIDGRRIALAGIDAPERGQRCRRRDDRGYDCGRIAATALMDLTAGAEVRCRIQQEATIGAGDDAVPLARCSVDGYDLSEGMVYAGWALADPKTGARLRRLEQGAREAGRGLWRGPFEPPWVWRGTRAAQ